jgi:putative transposase
MGMSRSAEKATVSVLREADRSTVAEPAKKNKVSEPVTSARQKHFRQIQVGDVLRLKAMKLENFHCGFNWPSVFSTSEALKKTNAKMKRSPTRCGQATSTGFP